MKRNAIYIITVFILSYIISCAPPQYRKGWMFYGSGKRSRIIKTANRYLGVRYKRGGTSARGFDCSGFVMYVYKKNGIRIPRTAKAQFRRGRRISSRRIKPGDLVFFQTSRKRISHVGIYTGKRKFIHAPRTGKKISYASLKNRYWRKRFRGAVTYLR